VDEVVDYRDELQCVSSSCQLEDTERIMDDDKLGIIGAVDQGENGSLRECWEV